jgi:hypothetical protein
LKIRHKNDEKREKKRKEKKIERQMVSNPNPFSKHSLVKRFAKKLTNKNTKQKKR